MGPPPFSPGLPAFEFAACTYLVPPGIVTFVNSNDTVGKMSQSIQAVGSLLQSPKSDILMVRNPGKQRELSASVHEPASSGRLPPPPVPVASSGRQEPGEEAGTRPTAHPLRRLTASKYLTLTKGFMSEDCFHSASG